MSRRTARIARTVVAIATAAAVALTLSACGQDGAAEEDSASSTVLPVPAAYRSLRAVYSLVGSFYTVSFTDGEQKLMFNAEGDVSAAQFAAWLPGRGQVVYESSDETRRSLWAYSESSGAQDRLVEDVDAVLGVRGEREVLYAAETTEGAALMAYDLQSGSSAPLIEGSPTLVSSSAETTGPICVAVEREDGGEDLYEIAETGDPRLAVSIPSGRTVGRASAIADGVVYSVIRQGTGDFGEVLLVDRDGGKPVRLAEEARLLDAAEDGGVLVQKNLRGGVSGVSRSLVGYIPTGQAAQTRNPFDLGAYVGTLHAASLIDDGRRALLSQRLEGVNRLDLYDLATTESSTFAEDRDLQVTRILPLDASSVTAVRIRPGAASGDGGGAAPSITSLADELVWLPIGEDAGDPVVIVSTPSGPLRLLGIAPAR